MTGTASAQETRDTGPLSSEFRRTTLGIVSIVTTVAFEAMSANMIMPRAAIDLGAVGSYGWVFSAFMAASLPGMVLAGRVTDNGRIRSTFFASLALLAIGLTLSGLSKVFYLFVLGRALQGFGGGLYIVALYVLIVRVYPERLRPRMFAVMPVAWAVASLLTPWLAGTVASVWSWRFNYLGVPPLLFVATVAIASSIRSKNLEAEKTGKNDPMVLRFTIAAAAGVGLLQYAGQNFRISLIPVLAVAVVFLAVGAPRLLPRGSLTFRRGIPAITALRGLMGGAFIAVQSFVPLYLVHGRGLPLSTAGIALSVAALGWAAGAWYQGQKAPRHSRRFFLRSGCGLAATGISGTSLLLFTALPVLPLAITVGLIGGFGMGMAVPSISVLLFEQSTPAQQGSNAAALQVSDSLGSAAALAVTGLAFSQLQSSLDEAFGTVIALGAVLAVCATLLSARCFVLSSAPHS
ncbi:MFS transporter [Streptomyces sp. NPDC055607]